MDAMPIRREHTEAVGNALARAFMDDPVNCYVLPQETRRWKLLSWGFPRWVRAVAQRGTAWTTPDFAGGALWRAPNLGTGVWIWDQVRAGLLLAPFKLFPSEFLRFRKVHAEATRRMRTSITTPHWVLDVLGVSPDRQGQGLSRCMVSPVLAEADAQGLPCYLITNKASNITIYRRFGFEVIEEGLMRGTDVMFYEMRRPSRS